MPNYDPQSLLVNQVEEIRFGPLQHHVSRDVSKGPYVAIYVRREPSKNNVA